MKPLFHSLTLLAALIFLPAALEAQTIDVVQPNGGEAIDGCSIYTIEWSANNTSEEYSIDYSTDGGVTWVSLASFLTNTTSFEWEAPNIYTSGALIRVYDAQFPEIQDQSESTFTISAPLQVFWPNGGEVLFTGEQVQVGYSAANYLGNVELQLSTNNGLSWQSVASNLSGGIYNWEVPNLPSTESLVRVGTDFNGCYVDESDAPFTIVSEVEVEVPNGGESYQATVVPPSFGGLYLMNNATITTDGGRFFDSGGEDGSDSNVNFTKYFWPATPNNELKVSFTRLYLRNYSNGYRTDRLRVYDATTNQQLVDFNGTQYTVDQLHQTPRQYQGKGLKFVFTNASSNGGPSDWDANIESIDVTYDDTTHPVDWDVQGTSKEFHLDYSYDGGLTWNRMMSNYYSPQGHYDWPVPNTPSTSCLVRVTDTENGQVVDQSDVFFEILEANPRMTHPNGGEQWYAGTEHDVKWVSDFYPSSTVDLSYSLDGGDNWLTLEEDVLNDGLYTWLLPSSPSTTTRVRVADSQDSTWYDDSDANFTIIPHITLTSPNGGQTLDGCASTTISWTAGGTSGTYNLELSIDGGDSWSSLASNISNTSWTWSVVDNITTDSALVRVFDANDASKLDESDSFFGLLKTTDVVMLAPNGGEVWYTGEVKQLNYLKSSAANNVNLRYSINGGASWSTIATNQSGGSYTWTVPNTPTQEALLRVQDQSVGCRVDDSDAAFTIVSEVEVEVPNGGESYQATVVPPSFGGYYIMDNGTITTDGGRFFDSGGEDGSDSNVNFTKYFWPATPNNELKVSFTRLYLRNYSNGYRTDRLRVYDATTNQQLVDFNGTQYTVDQLHQTPRQYQGKGLKFVFTNASSNGGPSDWDANIESIDVTYDDTTHPVDWDVQGTSKEFHLDYSYDGGLTWNRMMSNYYSPQGHYDWPVPNTPSTSCLVRVTDTENGQVVDQSDVFFEILEANPRMTHPNGGEQWYAGTEHDVKWVSDFYPSSTVDLSYSLDGGDNWLTLEEDVLNDGLYTWLLPSSPSTTTRVRVADSQDSTWYDDSDANFTIIPHITLTSPNGGQTLDGCASTTISWTAGGTSGTYNLELSIDGGDSWSSLASNISNTSWTWSVVDNITTDSALVRVFDANDASKLDESDSFFGLLKTTDVVMLAPNGGEVWYTGEVKQLNYLKSSAANNVNLRYSINGGASWSTIATNQSGGSYTWTVPNTPTQEALLRVQDQSVGCRVDDSDAAFTIVSEVEVEVPNGGESYQATVVPPSFGGYYIMDNGTITTDGGRFFDSGGEDGSDSNVNFTKYFWPATPNNELKVSFTRLYLRNYSNGYRTDRLRVYDATTNQQLVDFNGTQYTVDQLHQTPRQYQGKGLKFVFTNASSNGGPSDWDANIESIDVTYDDTTHPVDWDVQGTSKEFHLDYSYDGGLTWNRMMSNYYSPQGHYDWPVPNTPSTSCLVRVTDTENGQVVDQSDVFFEILEANPRMTHPNGGEQWYAGTEHDVKWVSDFYPSSTVDLSYSLDGGDNWLTLEEDVLNDGLYTWLLPSSPSTTTRVRVADSQDSTWYDDSDANFTIIPHITLTSPNGGQTLDGCASTTISWTAGGTSGTYNLELSIDGGDSWSSLASNISNTSWTWSVVDNITTDSALVRVFDANDASKLDESDSFFGLLKTTDVVMLAPNGGEVWYTGEVKQLNYLKSSAANNVNLRYSINGGASWSTIATNQSGGSYTWTVPNTPTQEALLRVQDQSVGCRVDDSDAAFTIVSEVEVEVPNGGESYQATVVPPSFGGYYIMDNGTITTDGGRFFDSGGEDGSDSNVNFTKYFWPATPNNELKVSFTRLYLRNYSNGYRTDRLRVYDATTNQQLVDFNGTQYTVDQLHQTPRQYQGKGLKFVFTNASSNGGPSDWDANIESIDVTYDDTTHPVDWDVQGTSKEFHLDYSYDGGLTWNRMMSNYYSPQGHYDWPVPNTPSTSCLVRVTDTENGQVVDQSDVFFEIMPGVPYVEVLEPNTATTVFTGSYSTVAWESRFLESNQVAIDYSVNNGVTWSVVSSGTPNDGEFDWLVPNTPSSVALIRVRDLGNNQNFDVSDIGFTISPPISLVTQNTLGADYRACTFTNIDWFAGGTSGVYDIEYSTDNGQSWTFIEEAYQAEGSFISYDWLVPNSPSGNVLVRVVDANNPTKSDISDNPFVISPTVELLSWSYGGVATVGEAINIAWSDTLTSNYFDLSYSLNAGESWTNIVQDYYSVDGQYDWTVPIASTAFAMIRVEDANNDCKSATSVVPFEISGFAPTIQLTHPNGGEAFEGCSEVEIAWSDDSENIIYNIEFRPSPNAPWQSLASNVESVDRTYMWSVPNEDVYFGSIRVRSFSNSNNYDVSDSYFTSTPGVTAVIESSSEDFSFCEGETLTLTTDTEFDVLWSTGDSSMTLEVEAPGIYTLVVSNQDGCTNEANVTVEEKAVPQQPVIQFNGPSVVCEGQTVSMSTESIYPLYWPELGIGSDEVQVSTPGYYSVVASNGECFTESDSVLVTVIEEPEILSLESNSPVFEGQTLMLDAYVAEGVTVYWSGPNGFEATGMSVELTAATPQMAGVYSVSASNLTCSSDTLFEVIQVISPEGVIALVTGAVETPSFHPVDSVSIEFTDAGTGLQSLELSDELGGYTLELFEGTSYFFDATKALDIPADNGITTLDILLAQAHILGNQPFDNGYAAIAADANASGSVSTLDLLWMQQIILQLASDVPGVESWEFVPELNPFIDVNEALQFQGPSLIPSLAGFAELNFVAVKRGDVNFSWTQAMAPAVEMPLNFVVEEVTSDNEIILKVYPDTENVIAGAQFTLEWPDSWEYVNWESALAELLVNDLSVEDGKMGVQFSATDELPLLGPNNPMMELHFASNTVQGEGLEMTSSVTKMEVCDAELNVLAPHLTQVIHVSDLEEEASSTAEQAFAEVSIYPNPSLGNFAIESAKAIRETTILDATGRAVSTPFMANSGNRVLIDMAGEPGMYNVILRYDDGSSSNHQIVVVE